MERGAELDIWKISYGFGGAHTQGCFSKLWLGVKVENWKIALGMERRRPKDFFRISGWGWEAEVHIWKISDGSGGAQA
eukprot:12411532-Karenia_brevis.AAC.1